MNVLALSTIAFQAVATIVLVVGIAVGAIGSLHRTHA